MYTHALTSCVTYTYICTHTYCWVRPESHVNTWSVVELSLNMEGGLELLFAHEHLSAVNQILLVMHAGTRNYTVMVVHAGFNKYVYTYSASNTARIA